MPAAYRRPLSPPFGGTSVQRWVRQFATRHVGGAIKTPRDDHG
jgi:hypothetical protein